MAKHTLMIPDSRVGRELRSIVWDDEAGTVEGEHSKLDRLRKALAEPTPLVIHGIAVTWTFAAPAHDPADFLALLGRRIDRHVLGDPLRSTLPPVFDGVEPTPGVLQPCPPGAVQ